MHSFQSYLDNFDGVAAAAAADPRAVSGDASSNTFSYALVGLRRAPALCCHPALCLHQLDVQGLMPEFESLRSRIDWACGFLSVQGRMRPCSTAQ